VDAGASSLDEDEVTSLSVVLADAFSPPDVAKSCLVVKCDAGGVLGEDPGLDRPDAGFLD
jgi:hypothetical protein